MTESSYAPLVCGCEWVTKYCDEHHYVIRAKAKRDATLREVSAYLMANLPEGFAEHDRALICAMVFDA